MLVTDATKKLDLHKFSFFSRLYSKQIVEFEET